MRREAQKPRMAAAAFSTLMPLQALQCHWAFHKVGLFFSQALSCVVLAFGMLAEGQPNRGPSENLFPLTFQPEAWLVLAGRWRNGN